MNVTRQQFVIDNQGRKIAVILPIKDYMSILEKMDELMDIKLYDAAKSENDEVIPFSQAINEIEAQYNDL